MAGRQSVQRVRGVVERTIPWLLRFKRVVLRYDRTQPTLRPLLTLASALISLRCLVRKEL
jgi:hypothetical protein